MKHFHLTVTARDRTLPIYLVTVGHVLQGSVHRRRGCPDFHWLHTISGAGIVEIHGTSRQLLPGQGFLMSPGTPCHYWPQDTWEVMWLTFNGPKIQDFLQSWGLSPRFLDLIHPQKLASQITDMLSQAGRMSEFTSAELSQSLYAFLIELSRQTSREQETLRRRRRLAPALQLLEHHYQTPLSLADLAGSMDITPQHLCRLFRSVFGMTPWNYLTALRMAKAKELLIEQPPLSVEDVGTAVGIASLSHFCALFRRHVGITPSEFRARNRPIGL